MYFFSTLGLFLFIELLAAVAGQRCSMDKMRRCKEAMSSSIQKRMNEMTRQDMLSHCEIVRDDFNCLVRETRCISSQSEKQSNGDIIRKGLAYIRDGCDTSGGGWPSSSCFMNDGMKTCERDFPLSGGQYSYNDADTCRKFNSFLDCAKSVVRNRCNPDDEKLLEQYFVAKTQELAYNCQSDTNRYSGDRDRDSGDRDRDRDRTYTRERDYDRDRGYDRRDRDRDSSYRDDYGTDRYGDRHGGRDNYQSGEITCCRNERCSNSRMSECRNSLTRTVDDRNGGGYNDEKKCRKARDDFNCLLWQTACLPREERDRNNEIFRRARDYISRYCDTFGRWSENSCYKSSEMQRCETQLTVSRGGASYESCRAFNNFRSCMEDELSRRCTREDDLLQGSYLVDKAQEMSWQCGSDSSSSTTSRWSSGSSYDNRDRDRGYGGGGHDSRYDRGRDSTYGSFEESELDTDDEMCMSRVRSSADSCRTVMNEKRRTMYSYTSSDYQQQDKKKCCHAIELRRCLYDATKRVCNQERSRVVNNLLERQRHEMNSDVCRGVYERDCSGGAILQISAMLLITLLSLHFCKFW